MRWNRRAAVGDDEDGYDGDTDDNEADGYCSRDVAVVAVDGVHHCYL